MTHQLDEVSRMLGAMQADIGHIRTSTTEANGKIDTLVKESILNTQSAKAAHQRLDEIEPEHKQLVTAKHRAKGAMVAYGSVGGILIALVSKGIEKLF